MCLEYRLYAKFIFVKISKQYNSQREELRVLMHPPLDLPLGGVQLREGHALAGGAVLALVQAVVAPGGHHEGALGHQHAPVAWKSFKVVSDGCTYEQKP